MPLKKQDKTRRSESGSVVRGAIVVSANCCWNITNFRSELIRDLIAAGHSVVVIAADDGHAAAVRALGAGYRPNDIRSSGLSPIADGRLLLWYIREMRRLRPSAFLGYTVKPNIYGSIAAHMVGARVINNISGLGTAFLRPGALQRLVTLLYRLALRHSSTVFFQNPADLRLFVERGIVRREQAVRIAGSGIDLERFTPAPGEREPGPFRFLLVARLLKDKGVHEFVEAARIVRTKRPEVRFELLGPTGVDNRSAVDGRQVEQWQDEGVIDYLGVTDDVRPAMRRADCIVLPSYREGLPRSLVEAAALAKPAIATDVAGCRDVIDDRVTGLLCEVRSAPSLAAAMLRMIELGEAARDEMGRAARRKAEAEFGADRISAAYRAALAR